MTVKNNKNDGRQLRSIRSREKIVDALLQLMRDGVFMPTAQQVADTAEVSIRSVFRHFEDMDTLYAEINAVIHPTSVKNFEEQITEGSLHKRLESAVAARCKNWRQQRNLMRATLMLRWRSTYMAELNERNQHLLRKDFLRVVPELADLDEQSQHIVLASTDFEFYDRLSTDQKQSEQNCFDIILKVVTQQFE